MEIILKKDMPNLGYVNDVVKVKNGYARNYLIPKGYAIVANETNKKVLAEVLKQKEHKETKILNDAKELATKIEAASVKIGAKTGTSGKIFGSINSLQISRALAEQCEIEVDRKIITIEGDGIGEVGNYSAKVKLHKEINATLNFEVVAE